MADTNLPPHPRPFRTPRLRRIAATDLPLPPDVGVPGRSTRRARIKTTRRIAHRPSTGAPRDGRGSGVTAPTESARAATSGRRTNSWPCAPARGICSIPKICGEKLCYSLSPGEAVGFDWAARAWRVDGRAGKGQDDILRHRTWVRLEERVGLLDDGRGDIRR